jgi:hypothetical protein
LDGSVVAARLAAALEISSSSDRDTALQSVAQDAASSRSVDVMKKALDGISSSSVRDRAAGACAVALAKAGDPAAAKDAAMLISNSSERDQALAKIATGK